MVADLCISRIQDEAQIMKLMLTSILSSECIPATRPRYQEPSSYSAQQACEKNNNDNIESDNIYPACICNSLKRGVKLPRRLKKIWNVIGHQHWTKVTFLCCFRLINMVHHLSTSATCTACGYNSETHLANRNKPIRHPVCWTFSAGIELPAKIHIQWILQSKLTSVMMLILKFKFR